MMSKMDEDQLQPEIIFDLITPGSVVALYSPPNAGELFYLCKVNAVDVAETDLHDKFNHIILKGSRFMKCNYLEKTDDRKGYVHYKVVKGVVFILPEEVFCPTVCLLDDLTLSTADYQFLCDMISKLRIPHLTIRSLFLCL